MLAVAFLHQIADVIGEAYAKENHVKAFVIDGLGRETHPLFRSALHNPVDCDVGVIVKVSAIWCTQD